MAGEQPPKSGSLAWVWIVIIIVVGIVVYNLQTANNQVVPPDPNAPPAPVVPQIPELTAEMKRRRPPVKSKRLL